MWGTLTLDYTTYIDGEAVTPLLADQIARDLCAGGVDFEDIRDRYAVRVERYNIFTREYGLITADDFAQFTHILHAYNVKYLFVYDGVRDFCALDWEIFFDKREFKTVDISSRMDAARGYNKVDFDARAELSGELGQRYSLRIWSRERIARGENVPKKDRHERTHGTAFYAFKNFFPRGLESLYSSFLTAEEYQKTDAERLYICISRFSDLCAESLGAPFCGSKKPLSVTSGGLAKNAMLSELYGGDFGASSNIKAFRKAHPITPEFEKFCRKTKLLRGAICYLDRRQVGKPITEKVFKYDVNSEYLSVFADMPDIVGKPIFCSNPQEFFKREDGYIYIAVFERFEMVCRKGFPAIFQNPFTGNFTRHVVIDFENSANSFSVFDFELDALSKFYDIKEGKLRSVIKFRTENNSNFSKFAWKWYSVKSAARTAGDYARAEFAKLFINSSLGKFSQRSDFPIVTHDIGVDGVMTIEKRINKEAKFSPMSVVIGAYIIAAGRCKIMDYILRVCGTENPREKLLATDTDSIHTRETAPAELVDPVALGALKIEYESEETLYLDRKAYYMVKSKAKHEADVHARGIPAAAIWSEVIEGGRELSEVFKPETPFFCPVLTNVNGGRVVLYCRRVIASDRNFSKGINKKLKKRAIVCENGTFEEV